MFRSWTAVAGTALLAAGVWMVAIGVVLLFAVSTSWGVAVIILGAAVVMFGFYLLQYASEVARSYR